MKVQPEKRKRTPKRKKTKRTWTDWEIYDLLEEILIVVSGRLDDVGVGALIDAQGSVVDLIREQRSAKVMRHFKKKTCCR